ncbi:MAG: flagellar regulator YcgR PilZN domain-containing protein [Burkholderiaceae bacterium]
MQPLGINALHLPEPEDDLLRPFAITEPGAIRQLLKPLFEQAELITVYAGGDNQSFLLTQIVAMGDRGLVIDLKTDEGRIDALTNSGRCTAISLSGGVKLQFTMEIDKIDRLGDSPSMRCKLPGVAYRIQRRNAFRVRPPAGFGAAVVLREQAQIEHRYELVDVSVTGISFVAPHEVQRWANGRIFEHSRLYLGMYAPLPCTVAVTSVFPIEDSASDAVRAHIGCALRHLSGDVERQIQRFVTDAQRANRLLPPL